jgi:hypothetical protein
MCQREEFWAIWYFGTNSSFCFLLLYAKKCTFEPGVLVNLFCFCMMMSWWISGVKSVLCCAVIWSGICFLSFATCGTNKNKCTQTWYFWDQKRPYQLWWPCAVKPCVSQGFSWISFVSACTLLIFWSRSMVHEFWAEQKQKVPNTLLFYSGSC